MRHALRLMVLWCLAVGAAHGEWLTDYDVALKASASKGRPVLIDFTGSDWCGWCIKLDREVFSTREFRDYADSRLILLKLDFPRSKPQKAEEKAKNEALASKYGVEGFPTVLIVDSAGKVLKKTGYVPGGPEAFIKGISDVAPKGSAGSGMKVIDLEALRKQKK
ncbi:MAG TPA: thioredoxin family protein [Verrucomicrobiae bacterium]|nr:thioredoxin family protein [Verrucomicrobiae bacterium]